MELVANGQVGFEEVLHRECKLIFWEVQRVKGMSET